MNLCIHIYVHTHGMSRFSSDWRPAHVLGEEFASALSWMRHLEQGKSFLVAGLGNGGDSLTEEARHLEPELFFRRLVNEEETDLCQVPFEEALIRDYRVVSTCLSLCKEVEKDKRGWNNIVLQAQTKEGTPA